MTDFPYLALADLVRVIAEAFRSDNPLALILKNLETIGNAFIVLCRWVFEAPDPDIMPVGGEVVNMKVELEKLYVAHGPSAHSELKTEPVGAIGWIDLLLWVLTLIMQAKKEKA